MLAVSDTFPVGGYISTSGRPVFFRRAGPDFIRACVNNNRGGGGGKKKEAHRATKKWKKYRPPRKDEGEGSENPCWAGEGSGYERGNKNRLSSTTCGKELQKIFKD